MEAFGDTPPYSASATAWKCYGSDWTGDLLQQFRRRLCYDLTPYLPALVQDIARRLLISATIGEEHSPN